MEIGYVFNVILQYLEEKLNVANVEGKKEIIHQRLLIKKKKDWLCKNCNFMIFGRKKNVRNVEKCEINVKL
jgi:hypothetical protein